MSALPAAIVAAPSTPTLSPAEPALGAIDAVDVVRSFDRRTVLDHVSMSVARGSIHALLGPNGAGKTTLLRILSGLLVPDSGEVRVLGDPVGTSRAFKRLIGLIPSGDRSFYLRISGIENLLFFARLEGMTRRDARRRAAVVLEEVGLTEAATRRVGLYSHGMQKRLSVARALLADPPVLLVDEATHDLDPEGARQVRELVAARADAGTAVVWATQRLDEIRAFADGVTLIHEGRAAFAGTVPELMAHAVPTRYLLRLSGDARGAIPTSVATVTPVAGTEHYLLALEPDVVLGDALAYLSRNGVDVLTCREERSEIEEAFLRLTGVAG